MTDAKKSSKKEGAELKMSLGEAFRRLVAKKPSRLAESLAKDVLEKRERAGKRIEEARKEIEDGALPRKGRFRL